MPRTYGSKLLLELTNTKENTLGVRLGRACIAANIPAAHVAKVLKISNTTVHKWFRGMGIREYKYAAVVELINLIELGLEQNVLPAANVPDAWKFLENIFNDQVI